MNAKTVLGMGSVVAMVALGCGGSAIPVAKVADSEATVRAADEAGAAQIPQAQLHLKLARDHLTKAQALIKDEENDRAALYLNQSRSDAELALALAHEGSERNATLAAQARLQELQQPTGAVQPVAPINQAPIAPSP